MNSPIKPSLTKEQALQKLKHYCGYQERCHQEVKEKLFSLGLYGKVTDELVSQLIEENYLNEERFAVQFAGGKFRMKQWGRVKIRHALQLRQVSEYCISKALQQIEDASYRQTLQNLAEEKWRSFNKESSRFTKQIKTQGYLLQKGYEGEWIKEVMEELQ